MSSIPAPRRIVASNFSVSGSLGKLENSEPAVQVITEEVPIVSELDGNCVKEVPGGGLVLPRGANIRLNEIPPGGKAPMSVRGGIALLTAGQKSSTGRTSTTDYNIFLAGSMVLVTPAEAYDPDSQEGAVKLQETVCRPGDVVVQRGRLHAWENRSGEWARFISVLLGAEETTVERSEATSQKLEDVFKIAL